MRILLVRPFQPTVSLIAAPPLGLLYLVSALRRKFGPDIHVDVLDMKARGLHADWLAASLDRYRPDLVGITSFNYEAPAARQAARAVKRHDPRIVTALGGPYAHRRTEEILRQGDFDWVVDGEADRMFPEAVSRHFGGGELGTDLPGVAYRRADGSLHLPASTDTIPHLDEMGFPAWDKVDFDHYARLPNMNNMLKGRRYAQLFTSRGCPYLCNYCHDIFGKKFRHRTAEHVIAEIELLQERYGVDEFQIVDDIFNLHKPRLKAIMGEVARRWPGKLKFCFPNGVRSDILDEPVLDALRAGGTYSISVAVETVTPRLQQLTEKHLDIDKAFWAIDAADRRGILVRGFFMLGFPTETPAELSATVNRAIGSNLTMAHFFTVTPQPGTPLYDLARKENAVALAATDETSDYHGTQPWYEAAYGHPLNAWVRSANLRFYFSPRRLGRILRRVPAGSLIQGLKLLMSVMLGRKNRFPALPPEEFGSVAVVDAPPAASMARAA